jgi:hypothetical protein
MGGRVIDVSGQRFGRLVAIAYEKPERGPGAWRCRCDCGGEVLVTGSALRSGDRGSCGCYTDLPRGELSRLNGAAGRTRSPERRTWADMIQRCTNPKRQKYALYGARGVTVCDRWRESFANFLADMGPKPSPVHTIDRVDNEKGYEPGNCRWATPKEQARNLRCNVLVPHLGQMRPLAEVAEAHGVKLPTAWARLRKGRTLAEVLSPSKVRPSDAGLPRMRKVWPTSNAKVKVSG